MGDEARNIIRARPHGALETMVGDYILFQEQPWFSRGLKQVNP